MRHHLRCLDGSDGLGMRNKRRMAILLAVLSASIVLTMARAIARMLEVSFPPMQWAALVAGVTVLIWWRELAN